ncbi:MAG: 50S ribosomal protein L32 [Pirellulaceae bacterium]
MAVPKRRHSNSRTGKRRAHDGLKPKQLTYCPKCSSALPTHVVCPNCGYYMGRTVVEMEEASS